MQLIEPQLLEAVDCHLHYVVRRLFPREGTSGHSHDLNSAVRQFVTNGGKRLRPQLCLWAYLHSCDGACSISKTVLDAASAWELLHAFLLAHDDIIDSSGTRRGQPSLHRRLAELNGGNASFGANLAIVAGDLLFCGAMRLMHELQVPDDSYRRLLTLFSRVVCMTGHGQALDIMQSHSRPAEVDEADVLRQYHWKTAAYTFEGPLLSGAMIAGLSEAACGSLSRFSLSLGQAYQLQNDLVDLAAAAHPGCDLVQGKRTMTLLQARTRMDVTKRCQFDDALISMSTANGKAVSIAESLRQELLDVGAADRTRELILEYLDQARDAAEDSALPGRLAAAMKQLLDSLAASYFVPAQLTESLVS